MFRDVKDKISSTIFTRGNINDLVCPGEFEFLVQLFYESPKELSSMCIL